MSTVISPTVGRVVWYHPSKGESIDFSDQPLAALVTYVWSDRMVNLVVFDSNGKSHSRTSVTLKQEGDELDFPGCSFGEWMPYQKGQAAKLEQVQQKASCAAQAAAADIARAVRWSGTPGFNQVTA